MILNCAICNIPGNDYGTIPVYNQYESTPSGAFSGIRRYFSFLRCPKCELWWVKDPEDNYESIYKTTDYWRDYQHRAHGKPLTIDIRAEHDRKFSKLRMPDILKYVKSGKAIDIGCSSGTLVKELKDVGFEAYGMEMNKEICDIARKESGCKIVEDLNEFQDSYFDFIAATDVLEHLREPMKDVKTWVSKLKVGGVLYIECPDSDCEGGKRGPTNWFDYVFPAEHIYYYNKAQVAKLLQKFNMVTLDACNLWTTDRQKSISRKMF